MNNEFMKSVELEESPFEGEVPEETKVFNLDGEEVSEQ